MCIVIIAFSIDTTAIGKTLYIVADMVEWLRCGVYIHRKSRKQKGRVVLVYSSPLSSSPQGGNKRAITEQKKVPYTC